MPVYKNEDNHFNKFLFVELNSPFNYEAPTTPEGASDHINFARSIENRRNI